MLHIVYKRTLETEVKGFYTWSGPLICLCWRDGGEAIQQGTGTEFVFFHPYHNFLYMTQMAVTFCFRVRLTRFCSVSALKSPLHAPQQGLCPYTLVPSTTVNFCDFLLSAKLIALFSWFNFCSMAYPVRVGLVVEALSVLALLSKAA